MKKNMPKKLTSSSSVAELLWSGSLTKHLAIKLLKFLDLKAHTQTHIYIYYLIIIMAN